MPSQHRQLCSFLHDPYGFYRKDRETFLSNKIFYLLGYLRRELLYFHAIFFLWLKNYNAPFQFQLFFFFDAFSKTAAFLRITDRSSEFNLELLGNNETPQLSDAIQFFLCIKILRLSVLTSLDKNLTEIFNASLFLLELSEYQSVIIIPPD